MRRFNRILKAGTRGELLEMRAQCHKCAVYHGYTILPNDKITLDLNSLEWSCAFSIMATDMPVEFSKWIDQMCAKVKSEFKKRGW